MADTECPPQGTDKSYPKQNNRIPPTLGFRKAPLALLQRNGRSHPMETTGPRQCCASHPVTSLFYNWKLMPLDSNFYNKKVNNLKDFPGCGEK